VMKGAFGKDCKSVLLKFKEADKNAKRKERNEKNRSNQKNNV